jgi:hypothetical protein
MHEISKKKVDPTGCIRWCFRARLARPARWLEPQLSSDGTIKPLISLSGFTLIAFFGKWRFCPKSRYCRNYCRIYLGKIRSAEKSSQFIPQDENSDKP